ncbi:MAG: TolC family protein [Myxococcota bacterium]
MVPILVTVAALTIPLAASDVLPEPLTLQQAIAYARAHAPATTSASAQANIARTRVDAAGAARWPTLQATVGPTAGVDATQTLGVGPACVSGVACLGSGASGRVGADGTVRFNWTLWDFGRTASSIRAAEHNATAAASDAGSVELQAALNAAAAFLSVSANEELMESWRDIVARREQGLAVAKERVRVGAAPPIEETRAQVSLETARLDLTRAEAALDGAMSSLAQALGLDPTRKIRVARGEALDLVAEDVEPAADQAEANRPELRAARMRVQASRAGEDVANAAWRPILGANASAGAGLRAVTNPALVGNESVAAGLTLTIPLFDQTFTTNRRTAHAQTSAAMAAEKETIMNVRAEAVQAAISVRTQRQSLQQAEVLLKQAEANLAQAEGRYNAGAGGFLELLDAQTQHAQARLSLVQARYAVGTAQVRLAASTGSLTSAQLSER